MEREELIKIILGERYHEGREIAELVLDYVAKNPDWDMGEIPQRERALDALDKAVQTLYGNPLNFYDNGCRQRAYVDIRQMSMHLYHKYTGFSLREVGEIFHKHHSTIIYAYKQVEDLLRCDRRFKKDYLLLEKTFKNLL